jgi:FSR family fosmidomycin resistance protein-like MFS transporter
VSSPTVRRTTLHGIQLTLLVTFAHSTNDAFSNVLPVFLPTIQARFSVGEAVMAVMVAVISISSNVLQPFFGPFVDRWGYRTSASLALIVGSTLMGFVSVAPSVLSLFFILAVGGLGSAIFHPAAAAMARDTGTKKSVSMSLFAAGGSFGTAVMPVAVLAVVRSFGTQYVPLISLFGVAIGLALLLLAPPRKPATTVTGVRSKVFDVSLLLGPVGLLAGAGILRAMAFISFTNGMPLYLSLARGFAPDAQAIGLTLSLYSISSATGSILAGFTVQRVGRIPLVVGSMLLALPCLGATLLLEAGSVPYYGAVMLAGLLTNLSIPILVLSAQDLAPGSVAAASGLLMGFTWGVAGVIYIGFGALQEAIGIQPALAVGFGFLAPAALLALYVLRRHGAAIEAAR